MGNAIVRKTAERMNGTMGLIFDGTPERRFWIQIVSCLGIR